MRKSKRLLGLMLVVLLCVSLCSCAKLDEMKEKHGVWQPDGAILWNDAVYKPLPIVDEEINLIDYGETVVITQPDVPVLLSTPFGEVYNRKNDGMSIAAVCWINEYEKVPCLFYREDKYNEILKEINSGFASANGYCFERYDMVSDELVTYHLTDEQVKTLDLVMETVEPETGNDYHIVASAALFQPCADDLYRRHVCDIVYTGGAFGIMKEEGTYWAPAEYESHFVEILQLAQIAIDYKVE